MVFVVVMTDDYDNDDDEFFGGMIEWQKQYCPISIFYLAGLEVVTILNPATCERWCALITISAMLRKRKSLRINVKYLFDFFFWKLRKTQLNHYRAMVDFYTTWKYQKTKHCIKMKFSIKDFFSKCDQMRSFLGI